MEDPSIIRNHRIIPGSWLKLDIRPLFQGYRQFGVHVSSQENDGGFSHDGQEAASTGISETCPGRPSFLDVSSGRTPDWVAVPYKVVLVESSTEACHTPPKKREVAVLY